MINNNDNVNVLLDICIVELVSISYDDSIFTVFYCFWHVLLSSTNIFTFCYIFYTSSFSYFFENQKQQFKIELKTRVGFLIKNLFLTEMMCLKISKSREHFFEVFEGIFYS